MSAHETEFGNSVPVPLRAVFGGAVTFGLTEDEVWQTVDGVMAAVGADATVGEFLCEVNSALAVRILDKERRADRWTRVSPGRRRSLFGGDR